MEKISVINSGAIIEVVNRPLDQSPAAVYLGALQPTGRRGAKRSLELITGILTNGAAADCFAINWGAIRFQHAAAIRARLIDHYAPATVNHALSALRGVIKAAWQLGQMTAEDYQAAAAIKSVRGSTLPAGRELTPGEIAGLMRACEIDQSPAGARDAAIIGLMYASGLRREEVITLVMDDYDPETGKMIIQGKGSKERTAYLTNGALYAMADWLSVRGRDPGALFFAINKSGKMINSQSMTPQAVYNLLIKRAAAAKVESFSPHDLRRTFVSDLLDAGADIATVAKMAGHSSVNTTARYDRRPEEAKKKAAELLHIPYTRRGETTPAKSQKKPKSVEKC